MNWHEEIAYRDYLMDKVSHRVKLSDKEKEWIEIHPVFNKAFGPPILNVDKIKVNRDILHTIRVRIEKLKYDNRIIPVFDVPNRQGEIITKFELTDFTGNTTSTKSVKMLGLTLDSNHPEAEFSYTSKLGFLSVYYECDFWDERQHLFMRKNSFSRDPDFAMEKQIVGENKVIYGCKSPMSNSFDSLVFSVEWMNYMGKDE